MVMVGIDVGATRVTLSSDSGVMCHDHTAPRDLLMRIADDVPYVSLDGNSHEVQAAHEIYASAVAEALGSMTAEETEDADCPPRLDRPVDAPVALAVPGWWAPRAIAKVRIALAERGITSELFNDAEASVAAHQLSGQQLPKTVAVVSLRAELSSVAIVRNDGERYEALLSPTLAHGEGGRSLDAAVLRHLVQGLEAAGYAVEGDDSSTIAAARRALCQCRELREALSTTAAETLILELLEANHRLRIVRSELEELSLPWADSVIDMVRTALDQCGEPVDAVLLTGGLASMPLMSQRISANLGLEVIVPEEPSRIAVRGAEHLLAAQGAVTGKSGSLRGLLRAIFLSGSASQGPTLDPSARNRKSTIDASDTRPKTDLGSFDAVISGVALETAPQDRPRVPTASPWGNVSSSPTTAADSGDSESSDRSSSALVK